MAVMAGKDGQVKVGTGSTAVTVGYIDNFSLSIEAGTSETSQLGQAWKEFISTAKGWSGSASGTFDYADAKQKSFVDGLIGSGTNAAVALSFVVSSALTLEGNALITNASIGASHGDKVTVSFNFTGTGDIDAAA